MNAPSPWAMAIGQMADARLHPERPQRFNPRPAGKMIPGSATCRVLEVLQEVFPASLPHHELMRRSGLQRGAIAWAVKFLHGHDAIDVLPTGHARYHRYRWKRAPEND